MKVNKTQWEFIGKSAGWLGNDRSFLEKNKTNKTNKTASTKSSKTIKVSKSKWKDAGIKAGWLKTASIGKFDRDASDVLEALVIRNKLLSDENILAMVKGDNFFMEQIADMGIMDEEILSYIGDIRKIYRV